MSVVDELRDAAESLAALDPSALTDDQLSDAVIDLHRLQARLDAQRVRLTAVFDTRRIWQTEGARSAAISLAGKTNVAPADLRRDVTLGRRLRAMPVTWDAFSSGAIGCRHAEMLAAAHASPRQPIADAFPHCEEMLVGLAKDLDFASFDAAFRYWLERTDQDGTADDAEADLQSRHLNLSQSWRQRWVLKGELDPVAGAEVAEALQRIYDELWVRHEALFDRAGWEALPGACRSRPHEAGGSLVLEVQGRVGAALTKSGRVGTARRLGPGERDGEVYGTETGYGTPFSVVPAPIWWIWAGQRCTPLSMEDGGDSRIGSTGREGGHGEGLRRSRGEAAGEQSGADPVERSVVNVGTTPGSPSCPASQAGQRVGTPSVDGPGVGRSPCSSPSTGKPCTWRRGTASSQSWGCLSRRHR